MRNIVMHLKLMRGMRGALLANVVRHHNKMVHIPPGSAAYLNLDEEMIARPPIIRTRSNLRLSQDLLDMVYIDHLTDIFKVDNTMVYQIFFKMFMTWMHLSM